MILNGNCPDGPIETAWDRHRFNMKVVNPANKRLIDVIVVGRIASVGGSSRP